MDNNEQVKNEEGLNDDADAKYIVGIKIETGTNIKEEKSKNKSSGFAIAAIILGILSIVLFCVWYISIIAGILGIIFGILGLKSSERNVSIGGIVTSAIGIVLAFFLGALIISAGSSTSDITSENDNDVYSNSSDLVVEDESENKSNDENKLLENEESNVSKEYQNALKKAESYAEIMHMSKQGIYDQLISEYGEKFPEDAAQYAIDNLNVDYKANALEKAKSYQETLNMSKQAIYDQLISEYGEKFTPEEAQYAIDNLE